MVTGLKRVVVSSVGSEACIVNGKGLASGGARGNWLVGHAVDHGFPLG